MSAFGETLALFKGADAAVQEVRNVFCVGRNYRDHAVELGNDVPSRPLIFGKSTHSLVAADGQVVLPQKRSNIHHELEIVLWIKGPYTPGTPWTSMVAAVGLGLDLTDRDAQTELKKAGQPWEFAKGFRGAAVVSNFYRVDDWVALLDTPFTLTINGKTVQEGIARDMLFDFPTLIDYVGTHFGLDAGDIVYTGTPAGVGPLSEGDEVTLSFAGQEWAAFRIAKQ